MLMIVEWLPGPSLYTCLYISVCLKFSIVKNVCVFFFKLWSQKLPGVPPLVWDPLLTVVWMGTRFEVDLSGASSASNLLCDVGQATPHL